MNYSFINSFKIYAPENKEVMLEHLNKYQGILVAMNAEKILNKENSLKELVNNNFGYSDGIGAVWALKQKGLKTTKLAGAELWLDIINLYCTTKSFYFVGASEKIIVETINKLKKKFPEIDVLGYRNGYITSEVEREKLIANVADQKPDIVFVAMGTPRQEYLMEDMLSRHRALYMGLGGSFDVYTGYKKRAPKFFQSLGLEWLYRLLLEPTRITRQIVYLKFILFLILKRL